jgi:hypothetical protein
MFDFSKLLSALKIAPYAMVGVAISTGIALFAPAAFVSRLGLDTLVGTYRPWIGATFLVSTVVFLSFVSGRAGTMLWPIVLDRWNVRQLRKELHCLSLPEQSLVAEFVDNETTTQCYFIGDGVVGGLVGKGILYRSSNVGRPGSTSFDHNIQPWAWKYLRQHPDLVAAGRGRERDV